MASNTTSNRNFEIYYGQTKNVAQAIGGQAVKVKQVTNELNDIAGQLTGSDAIEKIRSAVKSIANNLEHYSGLLKEESQVILDCAMLYEKAEADLLGREVTTKSADSSDEGRNTPVPPQQEKKNGKPAETTKTDTQPIMGWFDDIDVVEKDGTVSHYKKAFISSDGKVIAYLGKTSWKNSFLNDYKVVNGSVLLAKSSNPKRKVYEVGKGWIDANEQEGLAKVVLPILSKRLVDLEGEATLFGAQASGSNNWGSYNASAKILTAKGSLSVDLGTYLVKNPDGTYSTGTGLNVTAAASAAVVDLAASGLLGNTKANAGIIGSAGAKVLSADATGTGNIGWVAGKGPQIALTGEVGAKLVEANGSTGVQLAKGLSAKVSGSVSIGVGATGSIGYSDGKFHCEFGAALGIGFKVSFDIDLSGAVGAITSAVKSVYNDYWDFVKKFVPEDVANQCKKELDKRLEDNGITKTGSSVVDAIKTVVNAPPSAWKAAWDTVKKW